MALMVWRIKKEGNSREPYYMNRRAYFVQLVIGIVLALITVFSMWDGDILGEDTTGIATAIGIVGIALVAISPVIGKAIKC